MSYLVHGQILFDSTGFIDYICKREYSYQTARMCRLIGVFTVCTYFNFPFHATPITSTCARMYVTVFSYQLKMSESVIPLHINDKSTYPNASKWTIDEVVNYFTEIGFSAEAKAFKEQVTHKIYISA